MGLPGLPGPHGQRQGRRAAGRGPHRRHGQRGVPAATPSRRPTPSSATTQRPSTSSRELHSGPGRWPGAGSPVASCSARSSRCPARPRRLEASSPAGHRGHPRPRSRLLRHDRGAARRVAVRIELPRSGGRHDRSGHPGQDDQHLRTGLEHRGWGQRGAGPPGSLPLRRRGAGLPAGRPALARLGRDRELRPAARGPRSTPDDVLRVDHPGRCRPGDHHACRRLRGPAVVLLGGGGQPAADHAGRRGSGRPGPAGGDGGGPRWSEPRRRRHKRRCLARFHRPGRGRRRRRRPCRGHTRTAAPAAPEARAGRRDMLIGGSLTAGRGARPPGRGSSTGSAATPRRGPRPARPRPGAGGRTPPASSSGRPGGGHDSGAGTARW